MGTKLLWTGITFILALPLLAVGLPVEIVGAIFMLIGLILLWLDK